MSDDLVKRLREAADDEHDWAVDQDFWHEEILREAADRIEELEREKREAALDALAAMGQAQEAYEAQLKAEACAEVLEREAILDAKLLADTQALLDTAVEFIQEVRRNGDTRLASMAIAVLAEIAPYGLEGGKKDE